jgi:hypothetical protein
VRLAWRRATVSRRRNTFTRSRPWLSFGSGLGGSAREGDSNWGVKKVRRRPAVRGGPGSSVMSCGHGESEREGKKQRLSILTTTWSFWSTRSSVKSNGPAARRAPEARQWRRRSELSG